MSHSFIFSFNKCPLTIFAVLNISHYTLNLVFALDCCCCLVAKSHPTLRDPTDCSPPGSSVYGISQARILEWVVISFSRGSSRPRDQICASYLGRGFFTTDPPGSPFALDTSIRNGQ